MGHHESLAGHHVNLTGHHESLVGHHESLVDHHVNLTGHHESLTGYHESLVGHHKSLKGHYESLADVIRIWRVISRNQQVCCQNLKGVHENATVVLRVFDGSNVFLYTFPVHFERANFLVIR